MICRHCGRLPALPSDVIEYRCYHCFRQAKLDEFDRNVQDIKERQNAEIGNLIAEIRSLIIATDAQIEEIRLDTQEQIALILDRFHQIDVPEGARR
jgi:hypothetical protein